MGTVVAAVLLSRPIAMSKLDVVAIARVTLGTASAASPVSSTETQLIWCPMIPPAALIRSVPARHGADRSLPNSAAGPVNGAMTPRLRGPVWVGVVVPPPPQATRRSVALRARGETSRLLRVPSETSCSCAPGWQKTILARGGDRPPYCRDEYHNCRGPPAQVDLDKRLSRGASEPPMRGDAFETKYLPGLPPADGGCPPLQHRTERADGMLIEYDVAVAMRDGVEIYADVFRPGGDAPG